MMIEKAVTAVAAGKPNDISVLYEAGMVIVIGLVVVFLTLIALTAIFWLFGKMMYRDVRHVPVSETTVRENVSVPMPARLPFKPVVQSGVSDEVVAVIAAAVAAMTPEGTRYAIRSVRRAKGERSVWAAAGLMENTRPF